MTQIGSLHSQR